MITFYKQIETDTRNDNVPKDVVLYTVLSLLDNSGK